MTLRHAGANDRRAAGRIALLLALVTLPAPVRAARPEAPQSTLSALETDVDQIATRARPSLVTVFAQDLPRPDAASTTPVHVRTRVGSGVAVEESAILTTASVVIGADRILVRTSNGIQTEAVVAGLDPIYNVALLRVPELRLPTIHFAEGRAPQAGDWIVTLGTSYGAQPTQSLGTIAYVYSEPRVPLLQLTNTVYPGNSGGAALNPRGELVGLVQGELGAPELDGGASNERRPSSSALALPAATIRAAYQALSREGRVHHGYLGVTTAWLSVESEADANVRVPLGAQVEAVVPHAPAARADLRRGDLIAGFEGERVEYPEQLARWVSATPPGATVEVVWVRNEFRRSARIVLAESPDAVPQWAMTAGAPGLKPERETRITQLEQQIRELARELGRLKARPAPTER